MLLETLASLENCIPLLFAREPEPVLLIHRKDFPISCCIYIHYT